MLQKFCNLLISMALCTVMFIQARKEFEALHMYVTWPLLCADVWGLMILGFFLGRRWVGGPPPQAGRHVVEIRIQCK